MEEYTNKELYLLLTSHVRNFDLFVIQNNLNHDELNKNQKYTNGSVRKLQTWRAGIVGAISVIVFIIGVGVPLIIRYVERQDKLTDSDVLKMIDDNNARLGVYKK